MDSDLINSSMVKSLIIGAGQLGSRHLQGLLKSVHKQVIYILDPSKDSLETAETRANEINHSHSVNYVTDWNRLPKEFNLVIVATGANVRGEVATRLLKEYQVNNLVLEKILFQDLDSYNQVGALIETTQTKTWINHPRRMFPHYQKIKEELFKSQQEVIFQIVGGNWGLACNSLHYIDLCSFLTGKGVKEINFDWVDYKIHKSKRKNNIEFTGSVKGAMNDNSRFIITSFDKELSDVSLNISSVSQRWRIQEGKVQKMGYLSIENSFNEVITNITTEFQSTLTTIIANNILESGDCNLPSYKDACASHLPFIEAAIKKYNEITGINTNICPIT
jgi:Trk K+ transport system NAD-binding subunit